MDQNECKKLEESLELFLDEGLERLLLSHPTEPSGCSRSRIRPLLLKGELVFQAEEQIGKQAFHRNLTKQEAVVYVCRMLKKNFRQAEMSGIHGTGVVLVSKKGKITVKIRKNERTEAAGFNKIRPRSDGQENGLRLLEHNRKKRYILQEGIPVPFLVDLGVMTAEGKIVRSRYDKYRQINRFLEFIEDILPNLDPARESVILDFGCGKSYLTFAMYYYLKELKGYPVRIIGLDLKEDVIRRCDALAKSYGYDRLSFCCGDIASYEGVDRVDMVVTLHACDLATDYAMEKAVGWGAKVILSVPCCQHELNRQIENPLMKPVFGYGLMKERMAALYTDAIRAQVLEYRGYRTQILEFIDMEHTPKNILIRAVRQGNDAASKKAREKTGIELRTLLEFLRADPAIVRLLAPELGTKENARTDE